MREDLRRLPWLRGLLYVLFSVGLLISSYIFVQLTFGMATMVGSRQSYSQYSASQEWIFFIKFLIPYLSILILATFGCMYFIVKGLIQRSLHDQAPSIIGTNPVQLLKQYGKEITIPIGFSFLIGVLLIYRRSPIEVGLNFAYHLSWMIALLLFLGWILRCLPMGGDQRMDSTRVAD